MRLPNVAHEMGNKRNESGRFEEHCVDRGRLPRQHSGGELDPEGHLQDPHRHQRRKSIGVGESYSPARPHPAGCDDARDGRVRVDYIHKPFSPAVVKARVQTHLVLRGIREQLAQQLLAIQKEMETARQIQLSILPSQIPKIEGLDIAARYVPMTSVAGDFYDFIVVDEKHIGILVADVSGHGMPAALIASMLKIALSAQAANAADPAQV